MGPTRRAFGSGTHRRGTSTVELALTLPVLMVFVLGTIEVCQLMYVRQSATIVAYEGARLATRRNANSADVLTRCQTLLTNRRVVGGSVSITPSIINDLGSGEDIRVTISVPWSRNTPVQFVTRNTSSITVSATMVRE